MDFARGEVLFTFLFYKTHRNLTIGFVVFVIWENNVKFIDETLQMWKTFVKRALKQSITNYLITTQMNDLIYKDESFAIIGKCMEVHNYLGSGFLEIVYKDALAYEFKKAGIPFEREKHYEVNYKDVILPHQFIADFVVYGKIILEVKGIKNLPNEITAQVINYLKVSNNKLGLLINFGEPQLNYKRIVFWDKVLSLNTPLKFLLKDKHLAAGKNIRAFVAEKPLASGS